MRAKTVCIGLAAIVLGASPATELHAGIVGDGFPILFTNSLSTTEVCGTASGDIDHDWGASSPGACNTDFFYGSGSAYFNSPFSGSVTFCGTFDDRLNLFLDGQGLFSAVTSACATRRLTRGKCYELSLSYEEFNGLAHLNVTWGPSERSQETIPGDVFGATCGDARPIPDVPPLTRFTEPVTVLPNTL